MIRVCIDTNVFLNVWNKEIDPKTKAELWKGSAQVLQLIEEKVKFNFNDTNGDRSCFQE